MLARMDLRDRLAWLAVACGGLGSIVTWAFADAPEDGTPVIIRSCQFLMVVGPQLVVTGLAALEHARRDRLRQRAAPCPATGRLTGGSMLRFAVALLPTILGAALSRRFPGLPCDDPWFCIRTSSVALVG